MTNTERLEAFRTFARENQHQYTWLGRKQEGRIVKLLKDGPNMAPADELATWKEIGREVLDFQQRNIKRGRMHICNSGKQYVYKLHFLLGDSFEVTSNGGQMTIPVSKIRDTNYLEYEEGHVAILHKPIKVEIVTKINGKIVNRVNNEISQVNICRAIA